MLQRGVASSIASTVLKISIFFMSTYQDSHSSLRNRSVVQWILPSIFMGLWITSRFI